MNKWMNDKQILLQVYLGNGVHEYILNDFSLFGYFYFGEKMCDVSQNGRLHFKTLEII